MSNGPSFYAEHQIGREVALEGEVAIDSSDHWFKTVEYLQQNWALIAPSVDGTAELYFLGDTGLIFDEMIFPSVVAATDALQDNGFRRYSEDTQSQAIIRPPVPPYYRYPHPNGPIYSSGRYWVGWHP